MLQWTKALLTISNCLSDTVGLKTAFPLKQVASPAFFVAQNHQHLRYLSIDVHHFEPCNLLLADHALVVTLTFHKAFKNTGCTKILFSKLFG